MTQPKLCECGCEQAVTPGRRFVQHHHCRGRARSVEVRRKIGAGVQKSHMRADYFTRRPPSASELRVAAELDRRGIAYEAQRRIEDTAYFPDFSFPDLDLIIEVYGRWHHSSLERQLFDTARKARLESLGWDVEVIYDDEIGTDEQLIDMLDCIFEAVTADA